VHRLGQTKPVLVRSSPAASRHVHTCVTCRIVPLLQIKRLVASDTVEMTLLALQV
jgi:hypothetical protein